MKRRKRFAALVLAFFLLTALCACGAPAATQDDVTGTYTIFAYTVEGYVVEPSDMQSELTLKKDGTGHLSINGQGGPITEWTAENGSLRVVSGGQTMTGTVKNGVAVLDYGEGNIAYYAKEGADTSAIEVLTREQLREILAEKEPGDAQPSDDAGRAGVYRLTSATQNGEKRGGAELTQMESIGKLARLTLRSDGTGTMDLFGEETPLTWSEKSITANGKEIPCSFAFAGGSLTIEAEGEQMSFAKMTAEEIAKDGQLREIGKLLDEGRGYYYGTGGQSHDRAKAQQTFEAAARAGSGEAYYYLGRLQEESDADDRFEQAMKNYRKAAELGCPLGLFGEARFYQIGLGVSRDYKKARSLYEQAVEEGRLEANIGLGDLYRDGLGVKADGGKALEYYIKALEGIDFGQTCEAGIALGLLYEKGAVGLKKNADAALMGYQKMADAGYAGGNTALGAAYLRGEAVEQDYAKAKELL